MKALKNPLTGKRVTITSGVRTLNEYASRVPLLRAAGRDHDAAVALKMVRLWADAVAVGLREIEADAEFRDVTKREATEIAQREFGADAYAQVMGASKGRVVVVPSRDLAGYGGTYREALADVRARAAERAAS